MVDRAEAEAVRDDRLAIRFEVTGDMGSIEETAFLQSADGEVLAYARRIRPRKTA